MIVCLDTNDYMVVADAVLHGLLDLSGCIVYVPTNYKFVMANQTNTRNNFLIPLFSYPASLTWDLSLSVGSASTSEWR